ncbi:helix-turn-helix domain-containing protein [Mesorhizobium sp. LHD-90]|uniref:helix-turn-helix domain-containing protein n=1 Tax=Mesorhizobium sp. LHD-90 TaxID=3071414 RepID=UPI0027DF18D6|nr:helix-turn-helix domain-containing protein [Mesorhizobium sp. LHD-90]MDQ6437506.1 helix-turn-helix domain-containing protein [Mesorhizobium sp. LHD-90]
MLAAAESHVSIADGEAFHSTSRMLFGPISQRFTRGPAPSVPKLVSVRLGACRLSEIKANAHIVVNDRAFWRSFDPDAIKILIQRSGRSRFEQQSVAVDLGPRAALIYDPVRTYSLQNISDVDQLILQVPRSTFEDEVLTRLAAPISLPADDDSLTRIVSGLMEMAITETRLLDEAGCRRVGDSLVQLVNGLIRGKPMAPEFRRSPLEALRERIVGYIDANLPRSSLSTEDIAQHMGCSRRYLHRAFEGEGTTLERFIWDRRLERSKAALTSPGRRAISISEIAFACGFNSSAHFSRAFKSRYGVSPRKLCERLRGALH